MKILLFQLLFQMVLPRTRLRLAGLMEKVIHFILYVFHGAHCGYLILGSLTTKNTKILNGEHKVKTDNI